MSTSNTWSMFTIQIEGGSGEGVGAYIYRRLRGGGDVYIYSRGYIYWWVGPE